MAGGLDPVNFRLKVREFLGNAEKRVADGDIEAMRSIYDRHITNADPEMIAMALVVLLGHKR